MASLIRLTDKTNKNGPTEDVGSIEEIIGIAVKMAEKRKKQLK